MAEDSKLANREGASATVGTREPKELFNRVNVGRTSQAIVDQMRALIRQGELRPGDRLPSERDLCDMFGVSRVTVREALRVLEVSGLVRVRVGARGGAFVTTPSGDRVGEGIEDYLTLSSVTAAEVTQARLVLELGIVPLVCESATEQDISELLELCDRAEQALESGTYSMEMSAEFHMRVAQVAHNGAIELLLQPLQGPLLRSLEEAHEVAPKMGELGTKEHRQFVEAVRDGNVSEAQQIMRRHLERTASRVDAVSTSQDNS